MTTGKTRALTRWTFVGKVMSLILNMLSRLDITFLPRSKRLLISWLQSPSAEILEPRKMKSAIVSTLSPHLFPMKWWDQIPWASFSECWAFSQLFHSLAFTFIKRFFISSLLSAIKVVSSANLRLLIFLLAVLIPTCDSSIRAFQMVYSAYKLSKQSDNIQSWLTPFPILNLSVVPSPVLIVASCPAYRFLRRQVMWSDSHPFKNIPQFVVIHTVKCFSIVNETEVDAFLEFPCFVYVPAYVGNLISGSSAFSKSSLYIWKFLVHVLLKPSLKDFEQTLASVLDECNWAAWELLIAAYGI